MRVSDASTHDRDLSSWRFLESRIAKRPLKCPPPPPFASWKTTETFCSIVLFCSFDVLFCIYIYIFFFIWSFSLFFFFVPLPLSLFFLHFSFFGVISSCYFFFLFCLHLNVDFRTRYLLRPWFKRHGLFLPMHARPSRAKVMGNFPFVSIATKLCNRFVKLFTKKYCEMHRARSRI